MKIICRLFGGIGNQLFIYSAARRLAVKNNAKLILDTVSGFENDFKYQRKYQLDHFEISVVRANRQELLKPFSKPRRYLIKKFNKFLPYDRRSYIKQYENNFDSRLLNLNLRRNVWLEGYWQSEKYFNDIEDVIRNDLKIIPPCDHINLELANEIQLKMAIAVHVRFFDKQDDLIKNNLSKNYYHKALKFIENRFPNAHYFIFSDKPSDALSNINFPSGRYTLISHNYGDDNAYADLWLMSLCKNFIIANSTFSWWGAWLSKNKEKYVIAPSQVITSGKMAWGFEGLLPEDWIKL